MLSPSSTLLGSTGLRLVFALALVGCVFDPSGAGVGGDGGPADADLGADAAVDAPMPDGLPCTAAEPTCVGGDVLQSCVNGQLDEQSCAFGCLDAPAAHCGVPVLSNGLDLAWLDGADADVVVAAGETWVFETSSGVVSKCGAGGEAAGNVHTAAVGIQQGLNFQVRAAPTPADLAIGAWAFDSLRIEAGGTLRLVGAVPGALVVRDDARIEGVLDASAGVAACSIAAACGMPSLRSCGGPGGGDGGAHDQDGFGPGKGHGGTSGGIGVDEIGAGGAGFGAAGGASGGDPVGPPVLMSQSDAAAGGIIYGMPDLEPLIGGAGGGGGGEGTPGAGIGGGGGGALQIVALDRIEVLQPSGILRAGGAGGGAGLSLNGNGGGGGGSGGALLLEAARVTIGSTVAANGGGGGGSGNDTAVPGTDGLASANGAPGGTGLHAGGAGGAGSSPAGATGKPIGSDADFTGVDGTAGGGGGVGRIFLRALAGGIDLSSAIVSPAPGQGMLRVQ